MARNLAIEKQRRDSLNENFLELARLLPSLASARRLTKVLIVNESIQHLRQQHAVCVAAAQDMQDLLAENYRLVAELNALRLQTGLSATAPLVEASPVTQAMAQLMSVKDQVHDTFHAVFRDNWTDNPGQSGPVGDDGSMIENRSDEPAEFFIDNLFLETQGLYHAEMLARTQQDILCNKLAQPINSSDCHDSAWSTTSYSGSQAVPSSLSYIQPLPATHVLTDDQTLASVQDGGTDSTDNFLGV